MTGRNDDYWVAAQRACASCNNTPRGQHIMVQRGRHADTFCSIGCYAKAASRSSSPRSPSSGSGFSEDGFNI
eukprot:EC714607.1.p1 GENE.EC714607.1~~EC714607.1.p1  ORF type:complete len:72 (+),score=9.02 EC714607.1:142-357(+)